MASLRLAAALLLLLLLGLATTKVASHSYGQGFLNHSACLYAYLEAASLQLSTGQGEMVSEPLNLKSLVLDQSKSKCVDEATNQPAKLAFSLKPTKSARIKSVGVSMRIEWSPSEGYWQVSQANLTISRADTDRRRTFALVLDQVYASLLHSYSCNRLLLQSSPKRRHPNETAAAAATTLQMGKHEPTASLLLHRFQLQPFGELERELFAPSFDCSVWLSTPVLSALALVVFCALVVAISVEQLAKVEANEFKFSKEGMWFTQSQMEANKQQR